jgi:hypothetical protein
MARDEISYLLERMERQEIDVEKPRTLPERREYSEREDFLQLVREMFPLFRSGDWIKTEKLLTMCTRHGISFDLFCDALGFAQSDDGKWVAWPSDSTPETEPGRTRRKS